MNRPRIVVTCTVPGTALSELREHAEVVVLSDDGNVSAERLAEAVREADGLLSMLTDDVTRKLLEAAPRLRVVGNCAVGYDNVDVAAATELGIQVVNTPNVLTEATADLAWALLLAAARRIAEADSLVRRGRFERWQIGLLLGRSVHGRTLGIVGLGRIGSAVARRAGGFSMRVLYTQRRRAPSDVERALGAEYVDKERLVREADFVSLHAPLTEATRHFIDREALGRMKAGTVLVNTARGALVDEAALVDALAKGPLGAAGLDVFEREPALHPGLAALPNVVLAPLIGSATAETRSMMAESVARDIIRVLDGAAPENAVNTPARRC
jgi:glyoxylate reductase